MGIVEERVPVSPHDYFDALDPKIPAVVQPDSVCCLGLDTNFDKLLDDQDILMLRPPPAHHYQLVYQETQNLCYESVGDLVVSRETAFIESAFGTIPPFHDVVLTPRDETWELLPGSDEVAEVCSSDTTN